MTQRRRRRVLIGLALIVCFGLVAVAVSPTTIKRGLNYQVSTVEMPAYVKTIDFLHRHFEYKRLALEITQGRESDADKVLAVFDWTRKNIRPTPEGWPIVDDHILNIITRGYGVADQMADVFATLTTYGGVPAFWKQVEAPGARQRLFVSFARVDGRWVPFDVAQGFVFRTQRNTLASVEDIAANPGLVSAAAGTLTLGGVPYHRFFSSAALLPFETPRTLRTDLQKPLPRLWYEFKRAIRWEKDAA